MVVVAIAGGTGAFGRTVLDAIARSGEHEAIVLSRTAPAGPATNGPRRLAVDYTSVEQMKRALQEHKVEVVVSSLVMADDASAEAQINLIRAAAQSGTVTKFVPSEYYIDFHIPIPGSDLPLAKYQLESEAELERHPELTWTLVRAGIFMDHLAMPYNPKTTYLDSFWFFLDMVHEQLVLPGDGSQPLILTHSTDAGAYIDRLIGLPAKNWPRESLIASNRLKVEDLVSIVRNATGKDFKVTFDPEEEIRKGNITMLPSNHATFEDPAKGQFLREVELQLVLSMLSHSHNLPGKDLAELFPDVPTTNVEDFIRAGWEIKQSKAS